ncbi:hypothetical protein M430DRAFT_202875 [Amorphotheca resinae ATCC 22711]|jgi:hypothetical protein|uniref:Uncharacterized protein n=1 Tax=Amorphotheca resinae ATCC 22711 TaxID=857342 RepID=A0A2T3BAX7_AMORE|nr:hypothetical protein M430DRAFT_202875 [Amorphotheca resinae ATCC 22711]PSS25481.1 hypothetical protein M430DRAFT_202875 [Amorphotheca resinae ATCC 22711]
MPDSQGTTSARGYVRGDWTRCGRSGRWLSDGPSGWLFTEKQVIGILRNTTNPVSPSSRAAASFPFSVVFLSNFPYLPLPFFCTVLPIQTHPRAGSDRLRAEGRYSRDGGYGAGCQLWSTHRARESPDCLVSARAIVRDVLAQSTRPESPEILEGRRLAELRVLGL